MVEKRLVPSVPYGGGGAPTIAPRPTGAPGLREIGLECRGEGYQYLDRGMTPQAVAQGHNPPPPRGRPTKTQQKVAAAFHEVMTNEPSTVQRAEVSEARKQKMRVAIALNKARAQGASIPKAKGR